MQLTNLTGDRPFKSILLSTARAFGLLIKAIVICFVFLGVGGALAPFLFIGMILGMFPNIVPAVFSWVVTIPLLFALPFHAIYVLIVVITGKSPDYTKGIYGAVDWVERNRLYDPTFSKEKPKSGNA